MTIRINTEKMVAHYYLNDEFILENNQYFLNNEKAFIIETSHFPKVEIFILYPGKKELIASINLNQINKEIIIKID